jgi:2,4-dienoyl-CoA reductase-like NADH-dependent reductase (Old Yellow Enzyme family)/thioredoxin reductase
MSFDHLMSPGAIGGLAFRNRILMTPMGTNLAQADGHCGEQIQSYYETRARGGAGGIIVGVAAIAWPDGACNPNQVAISDDSFLPGLTALAGRIKQQGCRAAIQLQHAGKVAVCDIAAGRPMLVPSIPSSLPDDMMAALTAEEMAGFVKSYTSEGARIEYKVASHDDIRWLVNCFADAADRARRAGFDAVELHAGHGYILSEFLSPHVNKREDEYGGSLENRARLLVEVIEAVKARVGAEFPVWCRIDSLEYRVPDGIVYEDAVETARICERAGADAIHVSAYANPSSGAAFTEAPLVHQPGAYLGFAAGIKRVVSIPVIAVGRIEPEVAEQVLRAGEADFIAMGRKLLADPELPNKIAEGRAGDIRPCIYCYTCVSEIFHSRHVICAVNAETGHEHSRVISPARQSRSILVVGAGPAGMEAARVACLRGHQVTLCEAGSRLGGTVFFSSIAYAPNEKLIDYLAQQLRQMPVDIRLKTAVDVDLVAGLKPDAVVIATGALREAPAVPGAKQANVFSGDELRALMTGDRGSPVLAKLNLWQRLVIWAGGLLGITRSARWTRRMSHLWMPVGRRVAIVGGGLVGMELAEFLGERGLEVSVIEESDKFGVELAVVRRWRVLHDVRELGVVMINNTRLVGIEGKTLHLATADGEVDIEADTVILASGAQSNLGLAEQLQQQGVETHIAGDCAGVGYIHGAVHDGYRIANEL